MKAKFGAIVTDGRGKLSGHVFQQSRSGSTMKTKTSPSGNTSSLQSTQRAIVSSLSSTWRALSYSQRLQWNNAIQLLKQSDVFGNKSSISGFNLFMRYNTNLRITDQALINTPPSLVEIQQVNYDFVFGGSPVDAIRVFLSSTIYNGNKVVVYSSAVYSEGVTYSGKDLKKIGVYTFAGISLDLTVGFLSRFGSLPQSGTVFFKARVINSFGQELQVLSGKAIYV